MFHIIVFLTLLTLLACLSSGCEKQSPQGGPTGVRYIEIKGEKLVLTTELPGRVSAYMTSEVRPQVTGIVQERLFEEGADVKAGDVLYQIDPALFEAACNSAAANLAKAEANAVAARLLAERYSKIIKSNAVSRQEHDDAVSAYIQAQAAVEAARQAQESARINLGYTKITAPVSGRISRSYVTRGALVTQNQPQPLATIQHMDSVYVDVTQSSTEMLRLRRSLAGGEMLPMGVEKTMVKLKMEDGAPYARKGAPKGDAGEPDWIEGELLFADVTIERGTGVVNVRARFDNPDGELLPGMYVRAVFEEGKIEQAVLVPQRTVMRDNDGRAYVYVLAKDEAGQGDNLFTVAKKHVEIQRNVGNRWLISSGLEPGDLLLFEGHLKTGPGRTVSGIAVSGAPDQSTTIYNAGRKGSARVR
ncbi:efflux RND transporter periplasmic adaptor subunit [Desulfovibrio sp. OttesenSCG-928-M14]|nr:efflux RND transporter periplasmic adaptor subunit [Desulfovibrio sp. OttesenSCG-928-M14]